MSSSPTDQAQSLVDMVMPQMGTSMTEGTVIAWLKSVGDSVEADETLCEVSTDKIDTDCPAPVAGQLAEIVVSENETVDVGTVIARIAVSEGAASVPPPPPPDAGESAGGEAAAPAPVDANGLAARPDDKRRYSPLVRRIAAEHNVDLSQVPGTGAGGRVTKKDLLAWLEGSGNGAAPATEDRPLHSESPYRPDPAPAPPSPSAAATDDLGGRPEKLSRIRLSIGAAMLRSQQTAATCHTVVECDLTAVERRRQELGLTALPLLAESTIATLRQFPELNSTLEGETFTRYDRVHLGIAVSLGADGLIVPVIHDAQEFSAEGLASRIKDLARRARANQLSPDDVHGATFTITSPGAFGATIATPVINPPQVAILDVEAVIKRPVVETSADGIDTIAIRPMMNLVLGWDHRALDGVYAAQFLTALRGVIEDRGGA